MKIQVSGSPGAAGSDRSQQVWLSFSFLGGNALYIYFYSRHLKPKVSMLCGDTKMRPQYIL